mgnify:CR=1 FL=1
MGLGDLVLDTLKKVVDYVVELADDFADVLRRGILMIIEQFEREVAEDYDKIFPKEFKDYPLFANWESYIKEKAGKKPAVSGIILSSLIGGSIGTGIGMAFGGFGRDISNFFNSLHPVTPLPPDILAYGKHSGKIIDCLLYTSDRVMRRKSILLYMIIISLNFRLPYYWKQKSVLRN